MRPYCTRISTKFISKGSAYEIVFLDNYSSDGTTFRSSRHLLSFSLLSRFPRSFSLQKPLLLHTIGYPRLKVCSRSQSDEKNIWAAYQRRLQLVSPFAQSQSSKSVSFPSEIKHFRRRLLGSNMTLELLRTAENASLSNVGVYSVPTFLYSCKMWRHYNVMKFLDIKALLGIVWLRKPLSSEKNKLHNQCDTIRYCDYKSVKNRRDVLKYTVFLPLTAIDSPQEGT